MPFFSLTSKLGAPNFLASLTNFFELGYSFSEFFSVPFSQEKVTSMAMEGPVEDALDEGFHLPSNMSRCLSVLDIVMEDPAAKQFFSLLRNF